MSLTATGTCLATAQLAGLEHCVSQLLRLELQGTDLVGGRRRGRDQQVSRHSRTSLLVLQQALMVGCDGVVASDYRVKDWK
jgi:hypothetical protein